MVVVAVARLFQKVDNKFRIHECQWSGDIMSKFLQKSMIILIKFSMYSEMALSPSTITPRWKVN